MQTPKVVFRYSRIYDQVYRRSKVKLRRGPKKYPSTKKILKYIKRVEKLWRKDERKVLSEISKAIGLKWKSKFIICYVVGRSIPFSSPLTMPIYEKHPDYFVDVLTHELIHNLFVQNMDKSKRAWNYIFKRYKRFSWNTKTHIPLHAIHTHIYLKFYSEKRLERDIRLISFLPDYDKSWRTVQKEGYEKIIKEFRKRLRK